jgi:hypothetical protein
MSLNKLPGVAEVAMRTGLYSGNRIWHEDGFIGWVVWLFIHIGFVTSYRNRVGLNPSTAGTEPSSRPG